ncbi:MAG TPA: lysylphosphatidylglycerol synthase transmembrane domain-containing protein [Thermoanaerobaculaceae bacterium]|nr:lysylphosphatidylglycerol synthase transmembrane domain-containing protein [Thermoanaerobaculaceae bacterium]
MSLKRLAFGVQLVVTAALLALLFRNFDWALFQSAFSSTPLWLYLASFGALVAGQALYVFKWGLVLGAMGLRVPFLRLAEQYLLGIFFNNFLPTMIGGDAARVYYLGREEGYATVATSILVDRGLGFLSAAAWGTALVWWLDITTPAFIVARQVLTVLCAVLVAGLAAALVFRLAPLVALLRRAPLLSRVADTIELIRKRGRALRRRPDIIVAVLLATSLYFLPFGWVYQTYFRLAGGIAVPYAAILLVLLTISILSNIPISVNGIGLREQLHYLLFGSLGVSKELAVGISVIIFSQLLILSVLGGLVWLRLRARASLTGAAGARLASSGRRRG